MDWVYELWQKCFGHMVWDRWEYFGLIGEGLFFARLLVQWISSEKAKKPVLPLAYWYMSLAGCVILIAYAMHIGRAVVLLPNVIGIGLYARNLALELNYRKRERRRGECGFDRPDFPWPTVSVVVPVHNEAAVLAETLRPLCAQDYPRNKLEIIAALNGCSDRSREVAESFGVKIAESETSGMSFGKNLGGEAAGGGEILIFVDADTVLPPDAVRILAEELHGRGKCVGTVAGAPDRGGGVVRACFWLANRHARRKRYHAPGGVMPMHRAVWDETRFDEQLPQGTSTDFIIRARENGATYVYVDRFAAVTSIRRFEKKGIIRQMLAWRKNHRDFVRGRRENVARTEYEPIREEEKK